MAVAMIMSEENKFNKVGVRIHDVMTRGYDNKVWWKKEIDALFADKDIAERLAYVTIPKANSVSEVNQIANYMRAKERYFHLYQKTYKKKFVPIHIIIETQKAFYNIREIAKTWKLEVLDFGLMDFTADFNGVIPRSAMRYPEQFQHHIIKHAKTEMVMIALANGIVPAHNVTLDTEDPSSAKRDARVANKQFGFQRMWSIHINQIDSIFEGMKPDNAESEKAGHVLMKAQEASWGPIKYDGSLEDRATYRYYWSLLKRSKQNGWYISPAAKNRFFS